MSDTQTVVCATCGKELKRVEKSLSRAVVDLVAMSSLIAQSVYFTLSFLSPFLNITVSFYEPNVLVWAVEIILFVFSMVYAVFRMWEIIGDYHMSNSVDEEVAGVA